METKSRQIIRDVILSLVKYMFWPVIMHDTTIKVRCAHHTATDLLVSQPEVQTTRTMTIPPELASTLEFLRTHWFGWTTEIDEAIVHMFVQGLALGLAVVVLLDQFPGEPETPEETVASESSPEKTGTTTTSSTDGTSTKPSSNQIHTTPSTVDHNSISTETQSAAPTATSSHNGSTINALADDRNMSDGERALLEKILSRRRQEDGSWTPHQRLNYAVYAIIWMVAFGILWFIYNDSRTDTNHLYIILLHNFPREMRALGFRKE